MSGSKLFLEMFGQKSIFSSSINIWSTLKHSFWNCEELIHHVSKTKQMWNLDLRTTSLTKKWRKKLFFPKNSFVKYSRNTKGKWCFGRNFRYMSELGTWINLSPYNSPLINIFFGWKRNCVKTFRTDSSHLFFPTNCRKGEPERF